MSNFKIEWIDGGREATCIPDLRYPNGVDIDVSEGKPSCVTSLDYPAPRCGQHYVECAKCGANALVTAAGRIDDPRTVRLPCKQAMRVQSAFCPNCKKVFETSFESECMVCTHCGVAYGDNPFHVREMVCIMCGAKKAGGPEKTDWRALSLPGTNKVVYACVKEFPPDGSKVEAFTVAYRKIIDAAIAKGFFKA